MGLYGFICIAVVSVFAVICTIYDKIAARKNKRRIRESTLLFLSIFGGSATMLLTMLAIRHKTQHKKFMIGIPVIILIQAFVILFVFDSTLSVGRYTVESDRIDTPIRLMLVTDLHSCDYGNGQVDLLEAIEREAPDVVLLGGDIFDDDLPPDNAELFIKGVSEKYPCYYVTGNHEFWSGKADYFVNLVASYGVTVLEGSFEEIELYGQRIRIGGMDDPDVDWCENSAIPYASQIEQLHSLSDENLFTILLSHRPERMEDLLPLSPNLVLSGHAHGGQWRVPYLLENGLFSPDQGLFPKYTNGAYRFGDTQLIVSRGLARESTAFVPRVFNRPEIVAITLQ